MEQLGLRPAAACLIGGPNRYPVTAAGRVIVVLLMIVGVALLSVLTASIAWLVHERLNGENAAKQRRA